MTRIGRPRSGRRGSSRYPAERVSTFVKVTGRYPAPLAARLRALAELQGEPLWALLVEAAEAYVAAQKPELRKTADREAKRTVRQLEREAVEQYERNLLTKARQR